MNSRTARLTTTAANVRRRLGFETLESRELLAGDFQVPKDINETPSSTGSNPTSLVTIGPNAYFAANGVGGRELWRSDGTWAGTVLVKNIRAGWEDSNPTYLTNVGGTLFSRAYDHPTSPRTAENTALAGRMRSNQLDLSPFMILL